MTQCFACSRALVVDAVFSSDCGADQSQKRTRLTPLSAEGQAIAAALNLSLGSKIDQVSTDVKHVTEKVDKAHERLDAHDGRLDGQDQRISQLEAKAAENSSTHAKPQHQQVVTPYELRTIAVIGNLGWDSPSSELMDRAKKVLADAGVSGETYSNLCAITFKGDKGSSVQLCFQNPSLLQHASLAVRALRQSFSEERFVYLDVRKEQAERRPARVVSRMADFMADVEAGMEPPLAIEKVMNGKFVKVGGKRIGFTFKGEWKWTDYAITRYSGEVMQTAKEFAEGE